MESLGTLIIKKGCEWADELAEGKVPPPKISPFLYHKLVTSDTILDSVMKDKVTGFLLCDISPTAAARKYEKMNWPPIFLREEVEFDMIPDWMKPTTNKASFPRKTLLQSMRAKSTLIHTKLVQFYMKNGFKIHNVTKFIEYEPSPCFKDFFDTLYNLRVKATIENNNAQATAIKLTGNSPYGKVIS